MKKGFTLIELLAVIAILSIILLIAVPKVLDVINSTKLNAFKANESMIIKATRLYLTNNEHLLPAVNNSTEVSLQSLQTGGYIVDVKDPIDNSICSGYIVITNLNGENVYTPNLRCESTTITNSTTDGLVSHYQFDDFQEPTENISTSGLAGMNGITYTYLNEENGYKKYSISGTWNSGTYPYSYNLGSVNYLQGVSYSISAKLYTNVMAKFGSMGGIAIVNDPSLSGTNVSTVSGEFMKREDYIHSVNMGNPAYVYSMPIANGTVFNPATDFLYVKEVQVEKKPYSTPYVNGIRTGLIKDHTANNNNATLDLTSTPKWTNKMYEFNGNSNFISLGNSASFNLTSGTLSLWAKSKVEYPSTSATVAYKGVISKTNGGGMGGQSYFIDWHGTNATRTLRASIGDATGTDTISIPNFDFNDNFVNIVFTWDVNNLILYINGSEVSRVIKTKPVQNLASNLEIGRAFNTNGYNFNGFIDDVKIYNRALNNNEVKVSYFTSKGKYN